MYGGFTGKMLRVNLTTGEVAAKEWNETLARQYIGGVGLAAKVIWDETNATTEPFSAQNRLVFMTGPVTGTRFPSSGRWITAGLSPLTNIWGEAHAGGAWGYSLKLAGLDGIVVEGVAKKPVYLWVNADKIEIRDASQLWGKDTWTTDDLLKAELGKGVSIATIGPAGEKLVRFSIILSDGKLARVAARCGLGAVMGSKKLKAVAIRGNKRPQVYDEQGLKKSILQNYRTEALDWETQLKPKWTALCKKREVEGKVGYKNYQLGEFEGWPEKWTRDMLSGKQVYCFGCSSSCIESKSTGDKRRMTGMSADTLGSRCMIGDFDILDEAYDLCNRYGMDTTSIGGAIAFAMELRQKEIINRKDTGGIDLQWGNGEALLQMIKQIGEREGFGRVLGEGVKRAAESIGGHAAEYAMHIKGHEMPCHDVRSWNAGALEFATASSGAHHYEGNTLALTLSLDAFFGGERVRKIVENALSVEGIGSLTAQAQDYGVLIDSLVTCKMIIGGVTCNGQVIQAEQFLEWLNYITGWQMSKTDFLKAGERIFNLKRMINVRRGISRKDDTLPARFLTSKRGTGLRGAAANLPPLGSLLNEYYIHRGWSEEGIPTKEKLKELDLSFLT